MAQIPQLQEQVAQIPQLLEQVAQNQQLLAQNPQLQEQVAQIPQLKEQVAQLQGECCLKASSFVKGASSSSSLLAQVSLCFLLPHLSCRS